MFLLFNGLSGGEIVLIFLFVLVFFGADKIPGIARTLGKTINQFRDATREIQRDIRESADQIKHDLDPTKHLDQDP